MTFALAAALAAVIAADLVTQDRIVLQPHDKASPLVLACEIVDYTADAIWVRINPQTEPRRYPASEVVSVEAVQLEAHRTGVQRLTAGEIDEAERLLNSALQDELRGWVRREILGGLVRCAMRRGDRAAAGNRFLQIVEQQRAPREYPLIPLVWGNVEVGTSLRQEARRWLTGDSEVSRLLGASVLLLDPAYGEIARNELRRLSRGADSRVSALAKAQLWRLRVASPDVTANELAEWEREIERMPREVRAGGYFVLGRASFQRSEYDRAAGAFLWLTTVFSEGEVLAGEASVHAALALERLGRTAEARSLLEEVIDTVPWSGAAAEARSLLKQDFGREEVRRDG